MVLETEQIVIAILNSLNKAYVPNQRSLRKEGFERCTATRKEAFSQIHIAKCFYATICLKMRTNTIKNAKSLLPVDVSLLDGRSLSSRNVLEALRDDTKTAV